MQVRTKLSHLAKLSKLDFVDVPSALPLLELDQPGLVEETEGPTLPDELQAEPIACLMILCFTLQVISQLFCVKCRYLGCKLWTLILGMRPQL